MRPFFYLFDFNYIIDITAITVHVKGKEPVLFDPESDLTVQEAIDQIRDMNRLVGGSITTTHGLLCVHKRPLRSYQGKELSFKGFESAAKEGK